MNALQLGSVYFSLKTKNIKLFTRILYIIIIFFFLEKRDREQMENWMAFVGMVLAILAQASNMEVIKVAMSDGTNKFIMAVYSNAISSLILLPCALLFHRSYNIIPQSFSFLFWDLCIQIM